MRTATKSAIGILSLGVIAASYTAGTAAQIGFGAAPVSNSSATGESTAVDPTVVSEPTPIAVEMEEVGEAGEDDVTSVPVQTKAAATTGSTAPTATKSATATATPTPTPTATKTAAAAATPAATPTPTKTASTVATSVAKTGSAINYKYGTIQLEVVKTGSKITSVNIIWGTTKGREWASVPSMLVTTAIAAQGSGFSNISGATFTTTAFKSALDSALAKF